MPFLGCDETANACDGADDRGVIAQTATGTRYVRHSLRTAGIQFPDLMMGQGKKAAPLMVLDAGHAMARVPLVATTIGTVRSIIAQIGVEVNVIVNR